MCLAENRSEIFNRFLIQSIIYSPGTGKEKGKLVEGNNNNNMIFV